MSRITDPLGAILAGGRSLRMGHDKALVELNGRPMFAHVASTLTSAGCAPILIGRAGVKGVVSVEDDQPERRGPAAGLATALRLAEGRDVMLVATDQPLLRADTVRALLGLEGDAVVPVAGNIRQATCAVYRAACAPVLTGLFAASGSPPLQRLLDRVATREVEEAEWSEWGEEGQSWWSLDTAGEVANARIWLDERSGSGSADLRSD